MDGCGCVDIFVGKICSQILSIIPMEKHSLLASWQRPTTYNVNGLLRPDKVTCLLACLLACLVFLNHFLCIQSIYMIFCMHILFKTHIMYHSL